MKIGDGGAVSVVDAYGFPISVISKFISLSVVDIESHLRNNWSIWDLAT